MSSEMFVEFTLESGEISRIDKSFIAAYNHEQRKALLMTPVGMLYVQDIKKLNDELEDYEVTFECAQVSRDENYADMYQKFKND